MTLSNILRAERAAKFIVRLLVRTVRIAKYIAIVVSITIGLFIIFNLIP